MVFSDEEEALRLTKAVYTRMREINEKTNPLSKEERVNEKSAKEHGPVLTGPKPMLSEHSKQVLQEKRSKRQVSMKAKQTKAKRIEHKLENDKDQSISID